MIHNIDQNVGKILAKLDEWDIAKDTLVIFHERQRRDSRSQCLQRRYARHQKEPHGWEGPVLVHFGVGLERSRRRLQRARCPHRFFPTLAELAARNRR